MSGHRTAESASTKLQRIVELAERDQKVRFTSLAHLLTPQFLCESFKQLNARAAPGADGVRMGDFKSNLEENIAQLHEQLRAGRYRARPVRRVYIPKGKGKRRPLGIPSVADRTVQRAVARIIGAIYEPYFCDFSFGFRPGRSCHDALEKVRRMVNRRPINYVVDADIKGYFDTVNHQWLMRFLGHRIADTRVLRLVGKWLRSGIMENGVVCRSEEGTPQGGPISPLLANIYLHYVLDLWFEKKHKKTVRGACGIVRYADDFVVCFEHREEAERFLVELQKRFEQFQLELSAEKTRIVRFGTMSPYNGRTGPGTAARTFDFLGFTHYMRAKGRRRKYHVARKPSGKSRNKFLRNVKAWVTRYRHTSVWYQARALTRKLRGYYNYFGLRYCKPALRHVRWHVQRLWISALRGRSQRHRLHWSRVHRRPWFNSLPEPKLR